MRASRAGEVMAFRKVFSIGTFFKVCHKKNPENKQQPKTPTKFDKNSCINNESLLFLTASHRQH